MDEQQRQLKATKWIALKIKTGQAVLFGDRSGVRKHLAESGDPDPATWLVFRKAPINVEVR